MAPLDRAVAFADVHAVAVAVHDDLDLHVARLLQPLLEVQGVVAEGRPRLRTADGEGLLQLARGADHAHAAAAAARGGLDQHGVADALGLRQGVGVVAQHLGRAGHRGQPVARQQVARARLGGEPLQHLGRRPDEGQAVGPGHLGERVVLGEEAVARVDGVTAGDDGGRQDGRRREVAPLGLRRADADGLVGQLHGPRVAVGLAVGHDGPDAHAPARAQDAQGDLAAVRDEDPLEHQPASAGTVATASSRPASRRTSSWPYSTASPASAR